MNNLTLTSMFIFVLCISASPFLFEKSKAQENQTMSPRNQWIQFGDSDVLSCKEGLILLQKPTGTPACVSPESYLKLVDRGYGKFDSSQLIKRPEMMTSLMNAMIVDQQLMHHWHIMMLNDSKILQQTLSDMILQLKENPKYMANLLEPMIANPESREKMIEHMKNHNQMMVSLRDNSEWMESVHQFVEDSDEEKMDSEIHGTEECSGCLKIKEYHLQTHKGFHHPDVMEDLMHHIWVNEKMRNQIHTFMLDYPQHMDQMADQMMNPLLGLIMDDPELRIQMIEIMLDNQEFMNSIRHENNFSD
ncbi:MAG: hypothetical protein OEL77_02390 [Nitrosopumilus sp.]|nr:hypothetical protein [Nitrosopumilus sp.]MDH3384844.1 hypothetical protein [Nitrosopumilus sp.]